MTAESENPRALIETPLQQSRGSALFVKIRPIRGFKKIQTSPSMVQSRLPRARFWLKKSHRTWTAIDL
jgi:hypothetical protein